MGIITITADEALLPEFIEQTIITKMTPKLPFLNLFPVVDTDGASTFQYFTDEESAEDDIIAGKMSTPLIMSELGQMSKVNVSPIKRQIGDTYEFGYKLEFSKKVIREKAFIDEITRAYDRVAYGMQRKINGDIYNLFKSVAACPIIDIADGSWKTSSKIDTDIINIQAAIDQDGWDFELTDLYLAKSQFYQAKQFYRSTEVTPWDPSDVEGSAVNNAKSAIPDGTIFGLDNTIQPVTIYTNPDRDYIQTGGNDLIMVDKYQQQEFPKKQVIEIWSELGLGAKYKQAIYAQDGF